MSDNGEKDSITAALEVFGDRWSLLILRGVFRRLHRFAELRDDLGIASNLLTTRLTALVNEGVLERVRYCERPERFEYRLTESGLDLSPVLVAIMQWGDIHRMRGEVPTTLVHATCAAPIENHTRCTACGETLAAQDIRSDPRRKLEAT